MIIIANKQESEIIAQLRKLGDLDTVPGLLAAEVKLKRELETMKLEMAGLKEGTDRRERELRHMIGLEKKRQEVELEQATRDAKLTVREANLAADQKRFEDQLKFNTSRFESMEKYLKDMMTNILNRLPNVNVEIAKQLGSKR